MAIKRPIQYLETLSEKLGAPIPAPILDEVTKQMVFFARDYSIMMAGRCKESEQEVFGVELIAKEE